MVKLKITKMVTIKRNGKKKLSKNMTKTSVLVKTLNPLIRSQSPLLRANTVPFLMQGHAQTEKLDTLWSVTGNPQPSDPESDALSN